MRPRAALAGAIMGLLLVTAGCFGERLTGPTLIVRNDSPQPVVLRLARSKWELPAAGSAFIGSLPFMSTASVDILDAASCSLIETVALDFGSAMDQVLTVPASGAAAARAVTTEDQQSPGPLASMDPSRSSGPPTS